VGTTGRWRGTGGAGDGGSGRGRALPPAVPVLGSRWPHRKHTPFLIVRSPLHSGQTAAFIASPTGTA